MAIRVVQKKRKGRGFLTGSILLGASMILISSCATRAPHSTGKGSRHSVYQVAYGTDRKVKTYRSAVTGYGVKGSSLSYGVVEVTVPRTHRAGKLERPSFWKLEWSAKEHRHVTVKSISQKEKSLFFRDLRHQMQKSAKKKALVYVHGFNTSFEKAACRTAQLCHDLHFAGLPVFYSWPSRGVISAYEADGRQAKRSAIHLQHFLDEMTKYSGVEEFYLVGHSMGTRVLIESYLNLLKSQPTRASRIKEVILAAPDVDRKQFRLRLAPAMRKHAVPVTIYASQEDLALEASQLKHRGNPRLGDSDHGGCIVSGCESIDVTFSVSRGVGHEYFTKSLAVLKDLKQLISKGIRAEHRTGLREKVTPLGRYWELLP